MRRFLILFLVLFAFNAHTKPLSRVRTRPLPGTVNA